MAALHTLRDVDEAVAWLRLRLVPGADLFSDSRRLRAGDAFVAWPGYAQDGRAYVAAALAAGAGACLVEAEGAEAFGFDDARIAALPGLKAATGALGDVWYGRPSERLRLVATTGTNGKTSTAWWTAQALSAAGRRCGVIGTLGVGEPPSAANPSARVEATGLTTPDPLTLHRSLRDFERAGFAACALEASSIGLVEQRLAAARIAVALFTNFTPDHLDYHADMAAYWAAKRSLFDWPGLRAAVLNLDDARGAELAEELRREGRLQLWTYSVTHPGEARLGAENVHYQAGGLAFTVVERSAGAEVGRADLRSRLIGDYNVANLLAVLGGLRALGLPLTQAVTLAADFTPVPGRMDRVAAPSGAVGAAVELPQVVVDYAHTPDALDKALRALRPFAAARGGRLWCVFGCGGNRDAGKRPVMGRIASELADELCVTSDNPRHEDPQAIVDQVVAGCTGPAHLRVEVDRARAIALALAQADTRDVVLLAGKGHEDYQEVAGVKRPFLDAAVAAEALQQRAASTALGSLDELHRLLAGRDPQARRIGAGQLLVTRVHSDTRSLRAGDLFVALRGERFDANDFLPQAAQAGAAAALAERGLTEAALPGLQVADSLVGLQQLAAAWRASLQLPLIGVTGSNGKTTVTQMIASILRAWLGATAHSTAGNLNNHIGVPLTLLGLRRSHRAAVVELGMNHPGEIAELAALAQPTVALINNAQREHQEFMATVEAVARENGSVLAALPAERRGGVPGRRCLHPAVAGAGAGARAGADLCAGRRRPMCPGRRGLGRATTGPAAAHAGGQGGLLPLAVAGRHNVRNALAAAACALAAGCPLAAIVRGLQRLRAGEGPLAQLGLLRPAGHVVTLVDDSYNANPDSVRAAIEVLAELPAPRWLLLGDMGEVGDQGPAFHAEVGRWRASAASTAVDAGALAPCREAFAVRRRARISTTSRAARHRACVAACRRGRRQQRCWSRARASCAWNRRGRGALRVALGAPREHDRMLLSLACLAAEPVAGSSAFCASSSTSPSAP
jgi:murE/murF fusion protein